MCFYRYTSQINFCFVNFGKKLDIEKCYNLIIMLVTINSENIIHPRNEHVGTNKYIYLCIFMWIINSNSVIIALPRQPKTKL